MDEYEQVQQMRARMEDLQQKLEASLAAAALFVAALYDELGGDDVTDYVAEQLAVINNGLGDYLVKTHELGSQLY